MENDMSDYMVTAIAGDGQIRAFAATTRELVEEARQRHNTSPVATAALGRLLTAGAMMGTMMKGDDDVLTLKIDGDGPIGGVIVTADSQGRVKGYVKQPEVLIHANDKGKLDVAGAIGAGTLTIIRDIGLKEPYTGQINLVSGEIAEDLTYYYAVSEQTPSSVGLGVLMNRENTVRQAGGFILQLMPDATDEVITALEQKLASVSSVTSMLDEGMSPEQILEYLLGDMDLKFTGKQELEFYCNCDKARVKSALSSIGINALAQMAREEEQIEVNCQFCNSHYIFTREELNELIEDKKAAQETAEEDEN